MNIANEAAWLAERLGVDNELSVVRNALQEAYDAGRREGHETLVKPLFWRFAWHRGLPLLARHGWYHTNSQTWQRLWWRLLWRVA